MDLDCKHEFLKVTASTADEYGYTMYYECQKCNNIVREEKITYKNKKEGK